MIDFNKIRNGYGTELNQLKPLLSTAYQNIHDYQLNQTIENEMEMRAAIAEAAIILYGFIPFIPTSKGKYIQALKRHQEMTSFDLIICFDQAIYELHLWTILKELGIKRGKWSRGNQP
ncbi:hypothetical protein [Paenibacillus sp. UNC451MF]|uniref:hypothetical protein n=1 Tax=Paenibacillus sp. UNC451MF TaxID=1449063 RepID=UPI00048D03F8|nr:hypothetical protein [Paenibacillus sp. UNC451MF]